MCVCVCVFVCVRARGHVPTINVIAAWLLCVQVTCYAPLCARTGKYTRTPSRIKKKLTRTQKRLIKHWDPSSTPVRHIIFGQPIAITCLHL